MRRERAASPAAPRRRRRRPCHGSAAGDEGPVGGRMRSPGLSAPGRCDYTTAEILLPRRRPRRQNLPSPARGGPHMTHSAARQRCPGGRPRGLPASAWPLSQALSFGQPFRCSGFGARRERQSRERELGKDPEGRTHGGGGGGSIIHCMGRLLAGWTETCHDFFEKCIFIYPARKQHMFIEEHLENPEKLKEENT